MKNILNILSVAILILFFGCSDNANVEPEINNGFSISATSENIQDDGIQTKVQFIEHEDKIEVLWKQGDSLIVYPDDGAEFEIFTLTEGIGTKNAVFSNTSFNKYPRFVVHANSLASFPATKKYEDQTFETMLQIRWDTLIENDRSLYNSAHYYATEFNVDAQNRVSCTLKPMYAFFKLMITLPDENWIDPRLLKEVIILSKVNMPYKYTPATNTYEYRQSFHTSFFSVPAKPTKKTFPVYLVMLPCQVENNVFTITVNVDGVLFTYTTPEFTKEYKAGYRYTSAFTVVEPE